VSGTSHAGHSPADASVVDDQVTLLRQARRIAGQTEADQPLPRRLRREYPQATLADEECFSIFTAHGMPISSALVTPSVSWRR